jgi:GNAT superfamily N-acetyltransferase
MKAGHDFVLRLATEEDIPALHALIEASVRGLQASDYTQAQIDGALGTVLGLDTQLIRDGTYFVAEEVARDEKHASGAEAHADSIGFLPGINPRPTSRLNFSAAGEAPAAFLASSVRAKALTHPILAGSPTLAGCGGWSKRKTLFGADQGPGREPELLDPAKDAAKVRAIFVHPRFARRGLGTLILARVEAEARAAGFRRYEMGSTLTGVPLYRLKGYVEVERIAVPLKNGEALPVVKMVKMAGEAVQG